MENTKKPRTGSYEYNKKYRQTDSGKLTRARERDKYYGRTKSDGMHRRFTKEEIEFILAHEESDIVLATELGRTIRSIQLIRSKINTGNGLPKYLYGYDFGDQVLGKYPSLTGPERT